MAHAHEIKRILIAEPQCWGFEHAAINAAFLDMVLLTYPEAQVVFMGEGDHVGRVKVILERYAALESRRVEWHKLDIPKRNATGWLRFLRERRDFKSIIGLAQKYEAQLLLFTSVTNTGVLVLKLHLYSHPSSVPLMSVMHGMLSRIVGRWPHKPWNWIFDLRVVLRLPHPPSLRYVVLGDSILHSIAQEYPVLAPQFRAIDLPSFEYDDLPAVKDIPIPPQKLVFGFLGTGNINKGIGAFAAIAKEFAGKSNPLEFLLVGYLSSWRDKADYSCISGVTEQPLSIEEYRNRALSVTYAINTSNPKFYRWGVNSSILEAIFYGKPGIYLRSDYIENCFRLMGDIGYICDSYEEIVGTVKSIINEFPIARYQQQMENIKKGRAIFKPGTVALRFREIVNN